MYHKKSLVWTLPLICHHHRGVKRLKVCNSSILLYYVCKITSQTECIPGLYCEICSTWNWKSCAHIDHRTVQKIKKIIKIKLIVQLRLMVSFCKIKKFSPQWNIFHFIWVKVNYLSCESVVFILQNTKIKPSARYQSDARIFNVMKKFSSLWIIYLANMLN